MNLSICNKLFKHIDFEQLMSKNVKLFGFMFWLHLALIILAYSSPFLISWKLITVGVFLLLIQFVVLKQCILTTAQFGREKYMTFYTIYFEKLGFRFKRKNLYIFMRYLMPFIVLVIALIWQVLFRNSPLLF